MYKFKDFELLVAGEDHLRFSSQISDLIKRAAEQEASGMIKQTSEQITDRILAGRAVIAIRNNDIAGFCYIQEWSKRKFIAIVGLVVREEYLGFGLVSEIKRFAFNLARELYPISTLINLTTNPVLMNVDSDLGFKPVIYADLPLDEGFWHPCNGCENVDILKRTMYQQCLCTAMLFNPFELNLMNENQIYSDVFALFNEKIS